MNSLSSAIPANQVRVGVIGAGYFSQFHLRGWVECGANVVALCDVEFERARAMGEKFSVERIYTNAIKMLDRETVDIVDVVLPPAHQYEVVVAALEKRVPTICQKPFARSLSEARQLVSVAESTGTPLVVHENFRFMPWYREAKRLIDAGMLGELNGVLFRLRPGDGQGSDAYLSRQPYFQKMPRFLVAETAIHFVDTFRYLMGEIVAVTARLRKVNSHIAGEDAGVVVFEFDSGATGILDANRCNDHEAVNTRRTMGEMWLEGMRGCLRLNGDAELWWKPHGAAEVLHQYESGSDDAAVFGGGACTALQASALRALRDRIEPENTARQYLANIIVQEAIYQSHVTGQRIEIGTFSPPIEPLIPTL